MRREAGSGAKSMADSSQGEALAAEVKSLARRAGYTACGIAGVEPFEDYRHALQDRIARFPEVAALYERMASRADPRATAPWARSLVVCARRYGRYRIPEGLEGHIGRNYLCDRRYRGNPDYEMPRKLTEGLRGLGLRAKRGRTPDRAAAMRAGVARIGRNGFACTEHGSWINIETWFTDAELAADPPTPDSPCPEGCNACLRACPTQALVEPYVMRMDRCVAYLTYGSPEPIPRELWESMGPWIYGCDACQEACPLNDGKWESRETMPWMESVAAHLKAESLAAMGEEIYRTVVHPRFGYIPLDRADRWRSNARRALEYRARSRGEIASGG